MDGLSNDDGLETCMASCPWYWPTYIFCTTCAILLTMDAPLRVRFYVHLCQQCVNKPMFFAPILFTNEAHCAHDGKVCMLGRKRTHKLYESRGIWINLRLMFEMAWSLCFVHLSNRCYIFAVPRNRIAATRAWRSSSHTCHCMVYGWLSLRALGLSVSTEVGCTWRTHDMARTFTWHKSSEPSCVEHCKNVCLVTEVESQDGYWRIYDVIWIVCVPSGILTCPW
jgi:hypothetical protein